MIVATGLVWRARRALLREILKQIKTVTTIAGKMLDVLLDVYRSFPKSRTHRAISMSTAVADLVGNLRGRDTAAPSAVDRSLNENFFTEESPNRQKVISCRCRL
jgi:hypothetical protein